MMKLGTVLRRYRAIEDLTTRELADDIGLSSATLSRIENGKSKDITAHTLTAVIVWLTRDPENAQPESNPSISE